MEISQAKKLLYTLLEGVNPLTGEILPPQDSANQGEIMRAIYTLLGAVKDENKEEERGAPENAGMPWCAEDEEKLCQMYDNGMTQKEMCSYFKRSKGSIAARLVKLGKIQERKELS